MSTIATQTRYQYYNYFASEIRQTDGATRRNAGKHRYRELTSSQNTQTYKNQDANTSLQAGKF